MDIEILSIPLPSAADVPVPSHFQCASPEEWSASFLISCAVGQAIHQHIHRVTQLKHETLRTRHCDPTLAHEWANDTGLDDGRGDKSEQDGADNEGDNRRTRDGNARKKKYMNLTDDDLLEDWYDILKVPQGESASQNQIRAAYRQRCLETHPDKQPGQSDVLFKKVQRGFDILGDEDIRQTYDSSRPFDDSIPGEEKVKAGDFYEVFSPVFQRNTRWSMDGQMPSLGSDDTPYEEVMKFYSRWSTFRSWRDFSHRVEIQEVEEGMCREEKRYYLRENEKAVAVHKREEAARLKTLVERAKANDPRVQRRMEEEAARRQKEKDDREAFREKIREEAQRKRKEAELAAQAEEECKRQQQEARRQRVIASMNLLLQFLTDHQLLDKTSSKKLLEDMVREINVRWLYSKMIQKDPEVVEAMTATIMSSSSTTQKDGSEAIHPAAVVQRFNDTLTSTETELGMNRYGEPIKREGTAAATTSAPQPAAPSAPSAEWTSDDLSRLQKATVKYPPGSVERWTKIVGVLREKFTVDEAMAKVAELTAALHSEGAARVASSASANTESTEAWTLRQQKQLETGLRELKDYKEKDKFQRIAKMVDDKTAKDCFERYKYLCSLKKK